MNVVVLRSPSSVLKGPAIGLSLSLPHVTEPWPLDNLFRACRRCQCSIENCNMGNMDKKGPHGPFQGSVVLFVVIQGLNQVVKFV